MNGRERILATVYRAASPRDVAPPNGEEPDHRAFMPISMVLAADEIGAKYRDYATDWRVQVAGQLAFAEAFGADQVSVISDPGVEAGDLGAALVVPENEPASLDEGNSLLADKAALERLVSGGKALGRRSENRLAAVAGLAARAKGELLVEGWVEGPCAEAADLRGLSRFMIDFYDDPAFVNDLLDFVTGIEIAFARAQIGAGAAIIGVGDASSSLLGPGLFGDFVLERHRRYVEAIHGAGGLARLHICGNASALIPMTRGLGYDIIDLDSMVDIGEARAATGPSQVFTGNLDPVRVVRNGTPESIAQALEACSRAAGKAWIVGAGCEIPRATPRANILAMRDFARR